MKARTMLRSDAKLIAECCVDLADRALRWKDRALKAEHRLAMTKGDNNAK